MARNKNAGICVNVWEAPSARPLTVFERRALQEAGASAHVALSDFPPGHFSVCADPVGELAVQAALLRSKELQQPLQAAYEARMAEHRAREVC